MLISILMPTYNSDLYISKAIDSLNFQSNKEDFEIIFIDGLSNDRTVEIIKSECKIKYQLIKQQDLNMYDAINKGVDHARGKYLMFLNSDDRLYQTSVIEDICRILKNSNEDVCFCSDIYKLSFNQKSSKTYRYINISYEELLLSQHSTFLPHPGLIISKKHFFRLGGFDITLGPASDYDFCLRLIKELSVLRLPIISHEFVRRRDSLSHVSSFEESRQSVLKRHRLYYDYNKFQRVYGYYKVWLRYKYFNIIQWLKSLTSSL
tara:strand:- start:2622 stop:3410 length:789 start_codon:yes stop_codon:yes gene_type:complete